MSDDGSAQRTSTSVGRAAVVAGVALLALAILGAFANFAVLEQLREPDDAATTASNVADAATLFRIAIAALVAVAMLDVVVAWALLHVFAPASVGISQLAAWFRLAYAAVFVGAIAQLPGVLRALDADEPERVLERLETYYDVWNAGLVVFGVHLILVGWVVWIADYAPTLLGALLVIAGLGYLIDGFGAVLVDDYDITVSAFTFVGEVVLIFWLLLRGRRLDAAAAPPTA